MDFLSYIPLVYHTGQPSIENIQLFEFQKEIIDNLRKELGSPDHPQEDLIIIKNTNEYSICRSN